MEHPRKDYVVGSGNVFEDLGHPRPAEALAKAELARKIAALVAKRGLTQAAAANVLQIDQPKVSALLNGRLTGQGALFDMEKRNVLNPNATDPFVKTQIGRQRSRGAEAELTLDLPRNLYATAVYTYIDATVRNDVNTALIGTRLSNVPAHAASAYALKRFGPFGVGGGVTHVGRRAGDPFGTGYRLPAYTIARVNALYDITPRLGVRVDIDNLFDEYYVASSYANVWTVPGAPRSIRGTIAVRF